MSDDSIKSILTQAAAVPAYVPPVTPRRLGVELFERGRPIDECLGDAMRRGWLWAWRASSYADTSAFLVAQGGAQ